MHDFGVKTEQAGLFYPVQISSHSVRRHQWFLLMHQSKGLWSVVVLLSYRNDFVSIVTYFWSGFTSPCVAYRYLWVLVGPYGSLRVLVGPYKSFRVFMGPYKSLRVLISPYQPLQVLRGSLWVLTVLIIPYLSLQVLIGPNQPLQVLRGGPLRGP